MAYFAVMAAAMGLQQLKAWQDNKHKDLLSEKQKELRVALQKREFDRARNLQVETQRISLEMEREAHELRRKEIENEYDTVFDSLTDQFHLEKWPLNVVPFIMKGESFGSHVKGYDVASIHCVLTPSNNIDFNRWIYGRLDMSVEILMNLNWNSNTDHNIVYYGNSWKPKTNMGIPKFENSDVHRLYADLRNVPFICLTPYFKETTGKFYFHVRIWGMGADIDENSTKIHPPTESELGQICSESNFSEIAESIISQLSTYVVSMIGFIADMYYWKMYELPPMLPALSMHTGNKQLILKPLKDEYKAIQKAQFQDETFSPIARLRFIESQRSLMSESDRQESIKSLLAQYIQSHPIGIDQDFEFFETISNDETISEDVKSIARAHLKEYNTYISTFIVEKIPFDEYCFEDNTKIYDIGGEADLITYIEGFQSFIESQSERINFSPCLFLRKHKQKKIISLNLSDRSNIIKSNPEFAYNIVFEKIKYENKIKYMLRSSVGIICGIERIPKLIDQIKKHNLIY